MSKVLFVCLGNICRSPLAEGLANHLISCYDDVAVEFDSCGTAAYHIGEQPDNRTVANAKQNGVILNHQARQFERHDFEEFDYILVMDESNKENVLRLDVAGQYADKVQLMRNYDPEGHGKDVPDPYYGGEQGFQNVFEILHRSVDNFIKTELISK